MIGNFFAPLAIKVFAGTTVVLILTLTVVMWRADGLSEARDDAVKATITEKVKHEVTRASLASLSARMEALVKEGQLRRERLDEALEQVEADTAPLRNQADALERGEIDISQVEGL